MSSRASGPSSGKSVTLSSPSTVSEQIGQSVTPIGASRPGPSEGSIAVIYRLDALTQTFQRWIRDRPDLSNMTDVQPYDALLALNGSGQLATCTFSHYGQLATSSS